MEKVKPPQFIFLSDNINDHFMYRPQSFCVYLKRNSPNIYRSKKCFVQKYQMKLNTHFMFNIQVLQSLTVSKILNEFDAMHTFQKFTYQTITNISDYLCSSLFIHLSPFFSTNNWMFTSTKLNTTSSFVLQYHYAVMS
jgi:hypothetical protein